VGPDGTVAFQGVVGGPAASAPPGLYRLIIDSDPPLEMPEVRLEAGRETRVEVAAR
jgi:hypothetical protein